MTWWIGYARTGRELDVAADLRAAGIDARVPCEVQARRIGKRRRPQPVSRPVWPNYVFLPELPTETWRTVVDHPLMASTMLAIPRRDVPRVGPKLAQIERDFTERMNAIRAGERVDEYQPGDLLDIVGGSFAGSLATFRCLIDAGEDRDMRLVAEVKMLGRSVPVRLDPLHARAARA
ncbi:transcription termination/antitermination protein NusG [Pseudoroseicyclus sp. H15]